MFQRTRIRLTAWYLVIIMLVSITFSLVIYKTLIVEFNRVLRIEQLRREGVLPESRPFPFFQQEPARGLMIKPPDPDVIAEAKNRLIFILGLINLIILGLSGVAGYFLAGKTLKPIEEMIDEQNRFVTDSSHELRTPITALKSETEVTLRNKDLNLRDAKKQLLSNLEEINKLQALSDGLIKLTAYSQKSFAYKKGNNSIKFVKISITNLTNKAIKKVLPLSKQKAIIINNITNVSAEVEENTFEELFVILLDNAIKYNPKNTQITLSATKSDGYIEIEVKDNGVGIEKSDIGHLFDRFYRGDRSRTKSKINGYGLGLSIAKEIVAKHKGVISVTSETGEGATFTIKVPQKQ